jgi:hypothetical protein
LSYINLYMNKILRRQENLHIMFWLVKDTCWCLTFRVPALIMIIPTLVLAIYITWKTRNIYAELMHNLAICCWIAANSVWMIGEFYYDDGLRPYALVFFFTGLISISIYYGRIVLTYGKRKIFPMRRNQLEEVPILESKGENI